MDPLADEVRRQQRRFAPPPGMAELLGRWEAVVGPEVAACAAPARLGRDGTLHVATADAIWAYELGHRSLELAAALGVPGVRFAPGPLPERPRDPPALPCGPSSADAERARSITRGVGDENLRETVEKAVSLGLAKARLDHPF